MMNNKKGFTLIELLVVFVIAPLLAQFIALVLAVFIGGSIFPELFPLIGLLLWPFVGYILFYILVFLTSNKNKYGKHILNDSIIKDEITKFKIEVSKSKNLTDNKN
jgi:energy-coupling factor transporter transmembrane protein EcfT